MSGMIPILPVLALASARADPLILSFDLPNRPVQSVALRSQPVVPRPPASQDLFAGGSDSLVAKAIGSAEGTRTPEGGKTWAYYGHVDPGNGVWNQGSFSYQHGAVSPEDADERQLQRLQMQADELRQQASDKGMTLTPIEELNGLDLANQAPLAALDRGGYLDWLQEARRLGLEGKEAIAFARTQAFRDPDTGLWNASGLGNRESSIQADQERRVAAVERAIAASQTLEENSDRSPSSVATGSLPPDQEAVANAIIHHDLQAESPAQVKPKGNVARTTEMIISLELPSR